MKSSRSLEIRTRFLWRGTLKTRAVTTTVSHCTSVQRKTSFQVRMAMKCHYLWGTSAWGTSVLILATKLIPRQKGTWWKEPVISKCVFLRVGSAGGEEESEKSPEGIMDQNVSGDLQEKILTDSDLDDEVQLQSNAPTSSSSRTTAASVDRTIPYRPTGPTAGSGSSCIEPVGVCIVLCSVLKYDSNGEYPDRFMRPKVLRYCILLQVASPSGSSARSRLRLPRERRRTRLRLAPPAPEDQTAEDDTVLGSSPISQGGYVDDDTLPDLEPPSRHCNGQDQRPRGYIDYIEILSDSSDNTEEGAEVPVSIEPRLALAHTGESEMYVSKNYF